jgi:hypothetical protein
MAESGTCSRNHEPDCPCKSSLTQNEPDNNGRVYEHNEQSNLCNGSGCNREMNLCKKHGNPRHTCTLCHMERADVVLETLRQIAALPGDGVGEQLARLALKRTGDKE